MALQADAAPALSGEPAAGMGTSPSVRSAQGARPRQAAEASVSARQGFLFSPTIDLLFIANLFWPLLLIVDVVGGATTHESLLFWQIYFITAPHRWITLILVAFDREKTAHRGATFASLAIGILLVCLCLQFGTGSLLCLGVIDYIWNAWHFSAQHHGIFRIYERKGGGGGGPAWPRLEKTAFRAYLLFVIARVAGVGWTEGPFAGSQWITPLDGAMAMIPLLLVARQGWRWFTGQGTSLASWIYLSSVMGLFTAMLWASHQERNGLVIQLALASAVFHSVEYLSIVTWSMRRSPKTKPSKSFAYLSQMWLLFLAIFVVVIGAGNYLLSRGYFDLWVLMNLVVAFWHYCFDGMLWKSPKRPAAPALSPPSAS